MKKTILSFALLGVCSIASAQLSTRENQDTRYKFGGRPVAGDYALVFGFSLGSDSIDYGTGSQNSSVAWNRLAKGNLLTFKKFIQDDVALRLGLRLTRNSRSIKAEVDSASSFPGQLGWAITDFEYKSSTREYMIAPGIEKHFSSSNIFDVYVGGDLFLGFGRSKTVENYTAIDDVNTSETTMTTPYTIVGLGGVVGFNVFVLDLPIAIGVEYGLGAFWQLGNKTHVERTENIGGVSTSYEYYTVANDPNAQGGVNAQYNSAKQKFMTMDSNSQVRLVANIYFN